RRRGSADRSEAASGCSLPAGRAQPLSLVRPPRDLLGPRPGRFGPDPVTTILLLGGYGTFGRRLAPRLVEAGFEVLVAGRSRAKAEAFCAGRSGMVPLVLDRDRGLAAALAEHRPFALVDAAGPFQGIGYSVVRAAIAA